MIRGSAFLLLLGVVLGSPASAADPDALWHIVHDKCVPDQAQNHNPAPCAEVDLNGGYIVLKDIDGNTQYLLIPTARVSGIESPAILAPNAPNYWDAAWRARHFMGERAGHPLPRDAVGLAINPINARTQNQLHIHIDCMRLDVVAALREHAGAIGKGWTKFPVPLVGQDYLAMRLDQPELGATNPFDLLADGVPGARADMAHYTLVVVGADAEGAGSFVVLASHSAAGEQLQDHACAAAAH